MQIESLGQLCCICMNVLTYLEFLFLLCFFFLGFFPSCTFGRFPFSLLSRMISILLTFFSVTTLFWDLLKTKFCNRAFSIYSLHLNLQEHTIHSLSYWWHCMHLSLHIYQSVVGSYPFVPFPNFSINISLSSSFNLSKPLILSKK